MSEEKSRKTMTAGKGSGEKPAASGKRSFGKPAGKGSGEKPAASGKRSFGKPAGKRTGEKPASPGIGKPGKPAAGKRPAGGKPEAGRKGPYGRPAGNANAAPAKPVKPAEMEGLAARRIALKVLREVTEQGAWASLSLDSHLQDSGLSGADRRLASRLVYDTLDHLIYLDHMLSQVMAREDTDIRLRNILRLGACQLLMMDRIPESAATNTSVQLCTENGMEGLKGVCNGILRNLIRKKEELTLPDSETEPVKYFAVKYSLPEWLAARLRTDWGEETAERIASWRNPENAITIRRNRIKTDEAGFEKILEKKIWGKEKADVPDAWRIMGAMDISRDADFLAGNFSIQSESSQMVCLATGVRRGMQVLDCCAAPGGKTCYLSELMGDTGRVQAWDLHEHRVQLIAAQQKRLGLENIRPIQRDAAKYREDLETRMDAVLLDAPCSGLGVLAEKPDIKLRVTEEGVRELVQLQKRLLRVMRSMDWSTETTSS